MVSMVLIFVAVVSISTVGATPQATDASGPAVAAVTQAVEDPNAVVDPALYQALRFRFLGPYRGGRSGAVAGVPGEPHTFYLGASGGLFKTTNAGETWNEISDDDFEVSTIGAIAVAPSDPYVVYVGTGQKTIRNNVSIGKGMYRSTDAGRTWTHIGLRDAGQIGRIRVHPDDPDLVYVAVIGNPFGRSETRGVFRSRDGGASWEKILYFDDDTGANELELDLSNPRNLYATAWTVERKPWTIISGGEDDGIYKSTDSGDTWERLTGGLPETTMGKIGLALSASNPDKLYALVEADPEVSGLYISDDAGASWRLQETNVGRRLYERSWYYTHIFVDPSDEETVYVLAVDAFMSTDGGRTFKEVQGGTFGGDNHDLWINPDDPDILAISNDGGVQVTLDRMDTWTTYLNQPTAEIYNISVDNLFPYHVYASQQDNSTIRLPSRFEGALTPYEYWRDVGGCESAHIGFDPDNPVEIYAGCYAGEISRVNLETGSQQAIMHYPQMEFGLPASELRFRFNWNAPVRVSPHDPSTVYHAAQKVVRTRDGGHTWEVISPDLTTDNPETQVYSGAPITRENTGAEVYNTIFAFEESPYETGLLWAGTDDGKVWVSRDAGESWSDITPPGMPAYGTVNNIELSAHDPGRIFVAVKAFMLDDWQPYVFATSDYGATWSRLTTGANGIPSDTPVRIVREDPEVRGLLYAGTEFGLYVSFDDGAHWQRMQLNLPPIPITDMRVHRDDLVISTQGRGIYILDDVTPLHRASEAQAALADGSTPIYLFPPRDTVQAFLSGGSGPEARRGENPPDGVQIFYALEADVAAMATAATERADAEDAAAGDPSGDQEALTLEILGPDGDLIRTFYSHRDPDPNPTDIDFASRGQIRLTTDAGMNRFVWNTRYAPTDRPDGLVIYGLTHGPRTIPGEHRVRLSVGDWRQETTFRIVGDPRVDTPQAHHEERLEIELRMRDDLQAVFDAIRTLWSVRDQIRDRVERMRAAGIDVAEIEPAATSITERLGELEVLLWQPKFDGYDDIENFVPGIDNRLAYLYSKVDRSNHRPTTGQRLRYEELHAELEELLAQLESLYTSDVADLDRRMSDSGATPVQIPRYRR
jgi:photosystem II stability/assembly factor-like uncharacterized protein